MSFHQSASGDALRRRANPDAGVCFYGPLVRRRSTRPATLVTCQAGPELLDREIRAGLAIDHGHHQATFEESILGQITRRVRFRGFVVLCSQRAAVRHLHANLGAGQTGKVRARDFGQRVTLAGRGNVREKNLRCPPVPSPRFDDDRRAIAD